jgi:spore coat protein U-like protein
MTEHAEALGAARHRQKALVTPTTLLRRIGFCIAVFGVGFIATPAWAQCGISATNVAFGNVDVVTGAAVTTTGTITITCPGGFGNFPFLWICISIGVGTNSTSVNNRTMKNGTNALNYQLYTDSAMTNIYQYTTSNQFSVPYNNTTGATINSTVYGKILSSPTAPPASYTDSYSTSAQAQITGNVATTLPGTCGGGAGALTFNVTGTVVANASVSATTLNFGSTSTLSSNVDSSATVTVTATNTTPYSIGLGNGANASGSQRRARLGATANFINYNLYTDSAHSHAWTTTTSASSCTGGASTCALGTGTGSSQNTTVFGRVPPQSIPAAGTFTDTVVVTVTF